MTLADEDDNSIPRDGGNKAISGNGGQLCNTFKLNLKENSRKKGTEASEMGESAENKKFQEFIDAPALKDVAKS